MGVAFRLKPEDIVAAASASEDALVTAAKLLTAAGYKVIPPGDSELGTRPNMPRLADGQEEDRAGDGVVEATGRSLSAREADVLSLLAEGAPNKVIARRLSISVHTAKFHVASILAKLGAANRTDAIAIAMREGLVPV